MCKLPSLRGAAGGQLRYHQSIMSAKAAMISEFAWDTAYHVRDEAELLTPALAIYPEAITHNIECTLRLLDGRADRWRPHVKTAKLAFTMRMLVEKGIQNFKCATTLELLTACECGARDVLLAYPSIGANALRVKAIVEEFRGVHISVLIENESQLSQWASSRVGIFVDLNPGMNRTGIGQEQREEILKLVGAAAASGLEFRGLHYYDGQYAAAEEPERTRATHTGYDRLTEIIRALDGAGTAVREVITAGTPTFPCSLSYAGFRNANFIHRISPGTIVYSDATSLAQLPAEYGFRPAALVLSRVVSHPRADILTCDAGHKAVSADAGVPTCVVLGHPELRPLGPSEEHLPLAVEGQTATAHVGDMLYLLPRHVCPTVNLFDHALLVRNGAIEAIERVTARGREAPLLSSDEKALQART
ncbi:MAG TPA: D-TA family PLP-dependent enzyme [Candidatus Acidoferrum sp.]|nr:D-TA family PLP-dependent enzyme [Candidatus Acidoferrum sp.]